MSTNPAARLESLWKSGAAVPDVAEFIKSQRTESAEVVIAILQRDQEYRWRTDAPLTVDDYVDQFPQFSENPQFRLQLAVGEYNARKSSGEEVSIDDYVSGFGDISEELKSTLGGGRAVEETLLLDTVQIDNICDAFEQAWADGEEPSLESILSTCPDSRKNQLLAELLHVELWWRQKRAEDPRLADFLARFPRHGSCVRSVFRQFHGTTDDDRTVLGTVSGDSETDVQKPAERNYRVLDEVARGGMGVIHRVWDESLGRHVAMKVIRGDDEMSSSPDDSVEKAVYQRFIREAQITGQLDHPGVIPIHELGVDENNHTYFTMRLIDGDNLHRVFQLVTDEQSSWSQTRAFGIIVNVCNTVAFAHSRHIIHRDLKPANIMVGRFGETYVMDWGLARIQGTATENRADPGPSEEVVADIESNVSLPGETMDGTVLGTPAYMPPEQAAGRVSEMDGRSDIYSIGAMLYELMAGHRPYKDFDPPPTGLQLLNAVIAGPPTALSERNPRCPAELVAICEKAMARSPADRYQTAGDMAEDLQAYVEGRVVSAHRTGPWVELKKWVGRNRGMATAILSAVLIALLGLVAVVSIEYEKNQELRQANARTTQERNHAESLYLAQQANKAVETDPTLALLLAQQALQRDTNTASRTAFYTALGALDEKKTLLGHQQAVWRAAFSPDHTRILTGSDDATTALWDVASGKRLAIHTGHRGPIRAVKWSPDGTLVASAGLDGQLIVRDSATGTRRWTGRHRGPVWAVNFSSDNQTVVSASSDRRCIVWDARSGQRLKIFECETAPWSVEFSPDNSLVAIGSTDGKVRICRMDNQNTIEVQHKSGGAILMQFSDDGHLLMTSDRDHGGEDVCVWDPRSGKQIACLHHSSAVTAAGMSGDGEFVLAGQKSGRLTVWSVADGLQQQLHELGARVRHVDIAHDNRQLAACADNKVYILRLGRPDSMTILKGHAGEVVRVRFNHDASLILSCARDCTARLWANGLNRIVPRLETHAGASSNVRVSPEGDFFSYAYDGATVWRMSAAVGGAHRLEHHSGVLDAVPLASGGLGTRTREGVHFWHRDGRLIKTVNLGKEATIVASPDTDTLFAVDAAQQTVVEYSADGRRLAGFTVPDRARRSFGSALVWLESADQVIRIHHLRDSRTIEITLPANHKLCCNAVRRIVTRPERGSSEPARIWSLESGECLATLEQSDDPSLVNFQFVADETLVLAHLVSNPGDVCVWNAESGARLRGLNNHAGAYVYCCALPHGRRIVTVDDKAVRLWDLSTCSLIRLLSHHHALPSAVKLSHDGQFLALADADSGSVTVLRLTDFQTWCVLPPAGVGKSLHFNRQNQLVRTTGEGLVDFWQLVMDPAEVLLPRELTAVEKNALELNSLRQ